jgi:hypothetical protein
VTNRADPTDLDHGSTKPQTILKKVLRNFDLTQTDTQPATSQNLCGDEQLLDRNNQGNQH